MNTKKLKGFTLLEMIVVIAIISVLMMIIVPNMSSYIIDEETKKANTVAQQIYSAAQDYLISLQTSGTDATEFFGIPDGSLTNDLWYLGVDYSNSDSRKADGSTFYTKYFGANYNGTVCKEDIMAAYKKDGLTEDECYADAMKAANAIFERFSGDNECAFLIAVYPKTFTVKYVVATTKPNKTKVNGSVSTYNWPGVEAVGLGSTGTKSESYYTASGYGKDGSREIADYVIGTNSSVYLRTSKDTITHSRYQEYDSRNADYTRFIGQYPIPPVE